MDNRGGVHKWSRGRVDYRGCVKNRGRVNDMGLLHDRRMVNNWCMVNNRCMVNNSRGRCNISPWLLVSNRWLVRSRSRSKSFTRATLYTALEVTGPNILIENCSVPTLERVLLPILMAEMVNLTSSLNISIVATRVRLATAVKVSVSLRHGDRESLHRFGVIWLRLQQDGAYRGRGGVWLWCVCRLWNITRCWGKDRLCSKARSRSRNNAKTRSRSRNNTETRSRSRSWSKGLRRGISRFQL